MNAYEKAAGVLLREGRIVVVRWRSKSTGCAYEDGLRIEAPHPRGPVSFGTLAHEVGHCLLHYNNGDHPRWREETEAWEYALAQFDRFQLAGRDRCEADAARCLAWSYGKAVRRGVDPGVIAEAYPRWVRLAAQVEGGAPATLRVS